MRIFNLLASNITNLDLKLDGKLPIDRDELLALANSWGRTQGFYTYDKNGDEIGIEFHEDKENFDLSNLDVSEITNFDSIFHYSNFNGDISKWDVSNATSMFATFIYASNFNQSLNSWNISNVKKTKFMFAYTEKFNQAILWDLSKVESCDFMFYEANGLKNRFNNGKDLPFETNGIKDWLIKNKFLMEAITIKDNKNKELNDFLSTFNKFEELIK